ncbi:TlpA family protein disulfide reductase [Enemella sp. A6]|uniref:TlpA family protein disulfide reductase n=1 Tax=Enemella sp. A6 TaxID=3440152 RepID=UPI003EB6F7F7
MSILRRALVLFGVLTLGLVLSACGNDRPTTQEGFVGGDGGLTIVPPDEREPAPMISGPDLASEGEISLADHAGKVIVLNVWGSWCAPCRAEAPDLVAAAAETEGTAQFVGLNTRDLGKAQGMKFVAEQGIPYPSIFDPQGELLLEFSGTIPPSGIPTTLVIDKEGRVAARVIGEVNKTTLVGLVEDIAAGK